MFVVCMVFVCGIHLNVCVMRWSCIVRYLVGNKKGVNDPATHKWMLYVRGPQDEPRIDHFVDKVIFLLHDTYKPDNIVTVTYAPHCHCWICCWTYDALYCLSWWPSSNSHSVQCTWTDSGVTWVQIPKSHWIICLSVTWTGNGVTWVQILSLVG